MGCTHRYVWNRTVSRRVCFACERVLGPADTDAAIPRLARIQGLQTLDVCDTQLTHDGIARLRHLLLDVVIIAYDGTDDE